MNKQIILFLVNYKVEKIHLVSKLYSFTIEESIVVDIIEWLRNQIQIRVSLSDLMITIYSFTFWYYNYFKVKEKTLRLTIQKVFIIQK